MLCIKQDPYEYKKCQNFILSREFRHLFFIKKYLFLAVKNNSIIFGLEPFHSIFLYKTVACSNLCSFAAPVRYIHASTAKNDVEVHTVDTNGWIVLDSQINVFLDTKSKVTIGRKVVSSQFVFTDLYKTAYQTSLVNTLI